MSDREMLIELDGSPRLRCAKCSALMTAPPWNPPTWQCGGCGATEPLTVEQSRRAAELKRGRDPDPEPSKLTADEERRLWDVLKACFLFLERLPDPPAALFGELKSVLFSELRCPICRGKLEIQPAPEGCHRAYRCEPCRRDVLLIPVGGLEPPDRRVAHGFSFGDNRDRILKTSGP